MGIFRFKQFEVDDTTCAMKIGTDGVLVGAWAQLPAEGHVLDIGCGSGLISMMIAQRYPHLHITGIEIDAQASECARRNVDISPWNDRVSIFTGDALSLELSPFLLDSSKPLCLVSNPPFFTETLRSPERERALARHGEGLNIKSLIELYASYVTSYDESSGSNLTFIAPSTACDEIMFLFSLNRLVAKRLCFVSSTPRKSPSRVLIEAFPERELSSPLERSELCLRNTDGSWSDAYKELTVDYYLHF